MSRKIIKTSIIFTILSVVASALNFLFYPMAARTLSLSMFGDVQVGISFIMQAAALFASLNTLALFFAAQKSKSDDTHMSRIERIIIALSLIAATIAILFAAPISSVLQLNDASLLYLLALIFIVNIPASTWLGSFQGEGRFIASGVISVFSSFTKIAAGYLLILLGYGAHGALIGVLVGALVILPLTYFFQNQKSLHIRQTFRLPSLSDIRMLSGQPSLVVLFVSLFALALSSTLDVITAKAILHPDAAGLYAQISTAAKIPYFATVPIAIILFERLIKRKNQTKHVILGFSGLIFAITAGVILIGSTIMSLFFGLSKTEYDFSAFTMLIISFSSYALTTLLAYSFISHRQIARMSIVSIAVITLPVFSLAIGAGDIRSIALAYLVGQVSSLLVASVLQYTYTHEK